MEEKKNAQELFQNEALMEDLEKVTNADELVETLDKHNIQLEEGLTKEEAFSRFEKGQTNDDEISEEDLENVSGGFGWVSVAVGIGAVIIGGELMERLGYYMTSKAFGKRRK